MVMTVSVCDNRLFSSSCCDAICSTPWTHGYSFLDNYLEDIQLTWFRSIWWFLAHDDLWDWL